MNRRQVAPMPTSEGLNQSILDFQICTETGAGPDAVRHDQARLCSIMGGPSLARVASELVQRRPNAHRMCRCRH